MGDSTIPPAAAAGRLEPQRQELLGTIRVEAGEKRPLGGLNPYSEHFDQIGQQFQRLLIEHAGLNPRSRVLDVGCGTGRLAKQLLPYLDRGEYHGFDVNAHFIDYCQKTYKAKNFHFDHFDIIHDEYNPDGKIDPLKFTFPYKPASFDLAVVLATFNHFKMPWVFQYVRQISRMLRHKGIMMATMLLLNRQSMEFINTKTKPPYQFSHRTPASWHDFETRPLFNVAHPEEGLRRVFIKSGLMLREPIRYGHWCQSPVAIAGPDVLLARKGGWGD